MPYQYAQIPPYSYQQVACHYQTFDWNTSQLQSYPINASEADGLTGTKDQDNQDSNADKPKETAAVEAPVEEPSSSPADSSEAPESDGK